MTPRLLAWCRLIRLPNVFSAPADVLLGAWMADAALHFSRVEALSVAHSSILGPELALLILCSACLYAAGMVTNDLFDLEVDRQERPQRPLPSGSIAIKHAILFAGLLFVVGLLASAAVGPSAAIVAALLVACILGYNGFAKKTPLGPVTMGSCRLLNVVLGMAALWPAHALPAIVWLVPIGNGIYITGVTLFARQEATQSSRPVLGLAAGIMALGLGCDAVALSTAPMGGHALLVGMGALLFFASRIVPALRDPSPRFVQQAVKTAVLGIIVLDAILVLGFQGPGPAAVVLALLAPALWLGRWIYST